MFFWIGMSISVVWWIILLILNRGEERIWNVFFLQYLWEFMLGMIVAYKVYNGSSYKIRLRTIITMAAIGISVEGITGAVGGILRSFSDLFCSMGFLSIIAIIYLLDIKFINRSLIKISNISYEIYLLHWLVLSVAFRYIHFNDLVGQFLFGLLAIFICLGLAMIYLRLLR